MPTKLNQKTVIDNLLPYIPRDTIEKNISLILFDRRQRILNGDDRELVPETDGSISLKERFAEIDRETKDSRRGSGFIASMIFTYFGHRKKRETKRVTEEHRLERMNDAFWEKEQIRAMKCIPQNIVLGWIECMEMATPHLIEGLNCSIEINNFLLPMIPCSIPNSTWGEFASRHTAFLLTKFAKNGDAKKMMPIAIHFTLDFVKKLSDILDEQDIELTDGRRLERSPKGTMLTIRYR